MRIELAKILLQSPDVLLLDEPTNHLDIESIQWFENFLSTRAKAVILVSHDRAFLDAVTNRTIEIVRGKIYDYKASYSEYVELHQNDVNNNSVPTKINKNKFRKPKNLSNVSATNPPNPTKYNRVSSNWKN